MRVALVSPYAWSVPGGVNDHVANLAAQLEEWGHEATIIAPWSDRGGHADTLPPRFISAGSALPVRSNGSKAWVNTSPLALQRMDRLLVPERFDLVHAHEPFTPTVAFAAVAASRVPVVGTFHRAGGSFFGYRTFSGLVGRMMGSLAVRIAVSEAAREYVSQFFPAEYRVIPNGVTVARYSSARGSDGEPGRVLFVGRPEPRKGLAILLQAFLLLLERMPSATLVLVGTTPDQLDEVAGRVVPRLPRSLPFVTALGRVCHDDKVGAMRDSQVLAVPSLQGESFGLVLVEGMAAGVPVVASDIKGYRRVLREGELGLLPPPGDPYELAAALERVLTSPDLRRSLVMRGEAAVEEYDWPRVADAVLGVYQDVLEHHRTVPGAGSSLLRPGRS